MSVRPNIQSLVLAGTELTVRGESADPLPTAIFVVVSQDAAAGAAPASAHGIADRAGTGWRATLTNTTFTKGPAEAMGIQAHVDPLQVTAWVQSVTIA